MFRVDLNLYYYNDILWDSYIKQGRPKALLKWFINEVMNMDIYSWCGDNLAGHFDFKIDCSVAQLYLNYFYFEFEFEEDAVAFKLRWT